MLHETPNLPANLDLSQLPTTAPLGLDKAAIKLATEHMAKELASLQELLYANRTHSLLVVLQGLKFRCFHYLEFLSNLKR